MFRLSFAFLGWGWTSFFLQKLFIYVMLRLYTKFQCSTMPGTGQKVCGGVVGGWAGGWLKPILVFSLAKAEQKLVS